MQALTTPILRSTGVALALSAFAWSAPAIAQDEAVEVQSSSLAIDQVTVTARKREESAQSVPVPITALSTQLRESTIRDLRDVNGFAPNVRIDSNPQRGAGAAVITIRGISPVRSDDNSFDAPVGVAIDGVFLQTLGGQVLENFDLERIEVLRGPQGTLFGKNTIGGVVNVIRSRPTGEWGAKFKYTTGEHDQQEFRAVLNAPLIDGKLAVKGFFTSLNRDGYLKNDFIGISQPQQDYQNYGLTFLFTPNDWFEAILTVEKFEDSSQGGAFLVNGNLAPGVEAPPVGAFEPDLSGGLLACIFGAVACRTDPVGTITNEISTDSANPSKFDVEAVTLNMRAEVNDNITLVSITGYRNTTEDFFYDFDGTSTNFITIDRDNAIEQFTEEFRLEGSWETDNLGTINLVTGVYYSRMEFDQDWRTGGGFWDFIGLLNAPTNGGAYAFSSNTWFDPALAAGVHGSLSPLEVCLNGGFGNTACAADADIVNGFGPNFVQRLNEQQTTTSIAFFGQVDWEVFEGITVTGGLRWTEEKKNFQAGQAYLDSLADQFEFKFPAFANLNNKWREVSPKIGLSWQATEDLLLFASYAKGFHSGGFFGVNQNIADFERDQYDPEFSKNWEVGAKSQWWDNRLQVNLAFFYNDFKDKQEAFVGVDASTNTVATQFANVSDAVYKGFEVEIQAVVTEGLSVFGSVGYLDAKYKNFLLDLDLTDNDPTATDVSGLVPRGAPEWTFGVGGTYSIVVGNGGTLDLYVKYDWIDTVENELLNTAFARLPSRENLVASLTYSWETYSVSVFGRNLTNDRFETLALIQPLFAAGSIGIGATWGVEVAAEF